MFSQILLILEPLKVSQHVVHFQASLLVLVSGVVLTFSQGPGEVEHLLFGQAILDLVHMLQGRCELLQDFCLLFDDLVVKVG